MDPDRLTSPTREPLDDAALAAAVRETVADWSMPPQRLDARTWRERVGAGSGGSRGGRGLTWSRRLAGAATLAIVATVSLSYLAVWLTAPGRGQTATTPSTAPVASEAGSSARPSASGPAASPSTPGGLPKLVINGDLPTPSKLLVSSDGRPVIADLSTGRLAATAMGMYSGPQTIMARPGGGWVCICGEWTQMGAGNPNGLRITIDAVDATGASVEQRVLEELAGQYDPRAPVAMQPQLVDTRTVATRDGQYALIGRSVRDGVAGWRIGVDVLDLGTLDVTGSAEVTVDDPTAVDGRPRTRVVPEASVSPDGKHLLLTSTWYVEDPTTPMPVSGVDHRVATFADGRIGEADAAGTEVLKPAGSRDSGDCPEWTAGWIDDVAYYSVCSNQTTGREIVSRVGLDGIVLDTAELPRQDQGDSPVSLVQSDVALFSWDALHGVLARYDFRTGTVTEGRAPRPSSDGPGDLLASLTRMLGRTIAPTALAKVILDPALAVSPDGTRVYALGVNGSDGAGGSSGVMVFDAVTLRVLDSWAPLADYGSIAVSADGRSVYAAAVGGTSADGQDVPGMPASITVFDAADGRIRVVAGDLGPAGLWFTSDTVR